MCVFALPSPIFAVHFMPKTTSTFFHFMNTKRHAQRAYVRGRQHPTALLRPQRLPHSVSPHFRICELCVCVLIWRHMQYYRVITLSALVIKMEFEGASPRPRITYY